MRALRVVGILLAVAVAGGVLVKNSPTDPAATEPAIRIQVVAKQWLWSAQHAEGRREMNTIHVPAGQLVALEITSADIAHALSIPALGVRAEARSGETTVVHFVADQAGEHPFYCSKYCGPGFTQMQGWLVALEPGEYEQWLSGVGPGETPVQVGERLFAEQRCDTCHRSDGAGRGPALEGIFGRTVTLRDGTALISDEDYVRESILHPEAKQVRGYEPVMPSFAGRLSEEQLAGVLAYLRTLEGGPGGGP